MPSNAGKSAAKGTRGTGGPKGTATQRAAGTAGSQGAGGRSSNKGTIASRMVNKGTKLPNSQGT